MAVPFAPVHSSPITLSKDTLSHRTAQFQVYEVIAPAVAGVEARLDHAAVIRQVTVVAIVATEAEIIDMVIIAAAATDSVSFENQTNQANRK